MQIPLKFNLRYLLLAISLFIIEIGIALYAHDQIIRPYIGDVLVVILIYCFVKSFVNTPPFATAIAVLLFSFVVETLQYFQFIKLIGLEKSAIASVVIGTDFAWQDLIAYTIGFVIVLISENLIKTKIEAAE